MAAAGAGRGVRQAQDSPRSAWWAPCPSWDPERRGRGTRRAYAPADW